MEACLRPIEPADVPVTTELLAQALPPEGITPAKFARLVLLDPNFDASGAIVAAAGQRIIGFVYSAARQQPLNEADRGRGFITALAVAPEFRQKGIGTRLIQAAEMLMLRRGKREILVSPYAPCYFTPGIDSAQYPAADRLFRKLGYQEVSRPISMRCDLTTLTIPPFVIEARNRLAAEGVTVEPFQPAFTRAILDFVTGEFGADWEAVYRDTIQQILRGQASEHRVIVAHSKGTVLGVCHHEADRFGPIGVAAAARHQRIGQVLMYETLNAQRGAGHSTAYFLWSDDSTAARLYRGAGFVEVRRFSILRKMLVEDQPIGRG
ncbi:MAG: GNAT family N-acetyltransferase [Phycisphaerae bacterium]|nr:GNAT family N-acetyltransferase [Phycisphaerae bacterium]MDW8261960.1 GNAT family N-acetyltransferase [Phycisphaerales bacterium]